MYPIFLDQGLVRCFRVSSELGVSGGVRVQTHVGLDAPSDHPVRRRSAKGRGPPNLFVLTDKKETREAKVIVRRRADSRDPKAGAPRKDKDSRAAGVLDQFHALEYAAAAVQALAPDKGGRPARMEGIKQQSDDGQVARVLDGPKPHRDRDEAVAACIDCFEANRDRMPATAAGSAAGRSDPVSWKAPASRPSGAGSSRRGAAGRKRAPTPCSPPNAASKAIAGPTSSTGGPVAPQPLDQEKWDAPVHTKALDTHRDAWY